MAKVKKQQPTGSSVHVPATGGPYSLRERFDHTITKYLSKALGLAKEADIQPPVNNLDQGEQVDKETRAVGGMADNRLDGIYSAQQVIMGMDYELANNPGIDEGQAQEIAVDNLSQDIDHYRKKDAYRDPVMMDTEEGEQVAGLTDGLMVDLGSGHAREPGHIGFDLYPYDYGTVVHDLTTGIPLPDGSVSKCVMKDSLEYMGMEDPKPLLSEIQRVLMPGGQFVYQGPNQLLNGPEFLKEASKYDDEEDEDEVEKIEGVEGKPVQQTFTRLATPDAAAANDSEPRIGVAQFDMLPADALLAMDAMGYYFSDATSSGRGNRANGYPSQGALVDGPGRDAAGQDDEPYDLTIAKAAMVHKDELTAEGRKHVKVFALPEEGKYPIHDLSHARNALARASGKPEEAKVRAAVYRKWPSLKPDPASKAVAKASSRLVPIIKAAAARQIVYGVILTPDEVDLQGDFMSADDIEKACHSYMVKSRTVGKLHQQPIKAEVVECYIAPADIKFEGGQYGPQVIKKGSWVMGVHVSDPKEWAKVEDGEYQGFSVGGFGLREQV